jgi:hypothetical protein
VKFIFVIGTITLPIGKHMALVATSGWKFCRADNAIEKETATYSPRLSPRNADHVAIARAREKLRTKN